MGCVAAIGAALILFVIAGRVMDCLRSVAKDVQPHKACDFLRDAMLEGMHGCRTLLYNRMSGIMIMTIKTLRPDSSRSGKVGLTVRMARVPEPKRWCLDRARSRSSAAGVNQMFVWRWNLPSFDKGQVLLERDCGASITVLNRAIQELIERADLFGENPVFYVWSEGNRVPRVAGRFIEPPEPDGGGVGPGRSG